MRATVPLADPAPERVLAEIRHETGNYFHKLYYWSEHLRDHAGTGDDASAAQMLDRALHGLEAFLRDAFAFFHPIALTPIRMPVADVVAAVAHQAGATLTDVPCASRVAADLRTRPVALDPGQLSGVVQTVLERLGARAVAGSGLDVAAERVPWPGEGGVAFRFRLSPARGGDGGAGDAATAVLAWTRATRIVALHGGELLDVAADAAGCSVALVLPL